MKSKILFFLVIGLGMSCEQRPLEFEKLEQFSRIDTMSDNGKPYYFKSDVYIVNNYRDNLQNERTVDSFAYKNRAKDLGNYESYTIVMYKASKETNIENLKNNPKDFDYHSFVDDMIYSYRWGGVHGQAK